MDRVTPGADVIIVHDVTLLDYSTHNSKADRHPIGDHQGMGYEYATCLAVDPTTATTLGLVHDTLISADGPDDQDTMDYLYESLFRSFSKKEKKRLRENHRHQMAVHINGTATLLRPYHVIDVADREFDDMFILDSCRQTHRDFVIRSMADRNVQMPHYPWVPASAITEKKSGHALQPGQVCVNFKRVVEHVPLQPYKTLPLDAHNRVVEPSSAKRMAHLSIGAFQVRLYRLVKRNKTRVLPPRPVDVNVVIIREMAPPRNCKPLYWVLFTSLQVETLDQMAYVGKCYELRWKTEDFYKLLKSGYRIPESRLTDATKIARYLVVLTVASIATVQLKQQIGLPSGGHLSDGDYHRVKAAMRHPEDPDIDIRLRLFAFIAKTGGWIGRRRDPIGPYILMRGMLNLLGILDAVTRYGQLIEAALQNPDLLRRLFCV
jgi:hypothetical protein